MYQDTPRDHIGTVYETLMFGDNPLGWETLGTKETIKAATRDTFLDYVDEWYTPDRMVVGVSGMVGDDLTPDARGAARRHAPNGEPATSAGRARRARRARTSASTTRTPTRPTSSSACRAYPIEHPDRYALQMLVGGARLGHVVAPLPRGARAPRPRLLRPRRSNHSYTDAGSLLAQAGVDINRIDEAVKVIAEQFQPHRRRGRPGRRAREVALDGQGPVRAAHRGPAGADHVRPQPRGARGRRRSSPTSCSRRSTR